ncbi:MAG: hypothetical protein FJW27_16215 [Acidimicrobiia bacterium]|nr:hypothetical protein [Acidimicrobiia bacterium]
MRALAWALAVVPLASFIALAQRGGTFAGSRDHPAIAYSKAVSNDPVAALSRTIADGSVRFTFDPQHGYLRSVLDALQIPIESQVVVFTQTSKQAELITPKNPRALFFNDTTAVGWVRGADELEIAAVDPVLGSVFYALDQKLSDRPVFTRDDAECLACHQTWDTLGVPGWTFVSTFSIPQDKYSYASGSFSDHRSAFSDRWGGWFVTGKVGAVRHLGNDTVLAPRTGTNGRVPAPRVLDSLDGQFDTRGFISRHSDVAALMVLEHQVTMTNLITRTGWEARVAPTSPRVREAAVELVDYMLFVDEVQVTSPVSGSTNFAQVFAAKGPQDTRGRSLRQLDLQRRLLKYPCSYLVYSDAFEGMPMAAKTAVYERLWAVLSGQVTGDVYTRLTRDDRVAVAEILHDTKPGLPAFFDPGAIR